MTSYAGKSIRSTADQDLNTNSSVRFGSVQAQELKQGDEFGQVLYTLPTSQGSANDVMYRTGTPGEVLWGPLGAVIIPDHLEAKSYGVKNAVDDAQNWRWSAPDGPELKLEQDLDGISFATVKSVVPDAIGYQETLEGRLVAKDVRTPLVTLDQGLSTARWRIRHEEFGDRMVIEYSNDNGSTYTSWMTFNQTNPDIDVSQPMRAPQVGFDLGGAKRWRMRHNPATDDLALDFSSDSGSTWLPWLNFNEGASVLQVWNDVEMRGGVIYGDLVRMITVHADEQFILTQNAPNTIPVGASVLEWQSGLAGEGTEYTLTTSRIANNPTNTTTEAVLYAKNPLYFSWFTPAAGASTMTWHISTAALSVGNMSANGYFLGIMAPQPQTRWQADSSGFYPPYNSSGFYGVRFTTDVCTSIFNGVQDTSVVDSDGITVDGQSDPFVIQLSYNGASTLRLIITCTNLNSSPGYVMCNIVLPYTSTVAYYPCICFAGGVSPHFGITATIGSFATTGSFSPYEGGSVARLDSPTTPTQLLTLNTTPTQSEILAQRSAQFAHETKEFTCQDRFAYGFNQRPRFGLVPQTRLFTTCGALAIPNTGAEVTFTSDDLGTFSRGYPGIPERIAQRLGQVLNFRMRGSMTTTNAADRLTIRMRYRGTPVASSTVNFDVSSPLVNTPWEITGTLTITAQLFNTCRVLCSGWFRYESEPSAQGKDSMEGASIRPSNGFVTPTQISGTSGNDQFIDKPLSASFQFDDPDPVASFTCNLIEYDLNDSYV